MTGCAGCGNTVPPSKGRKPRKWCSDECRRSHSRLAGDPEVLSLDEVLVLLSKAARSGTVSAMQSLLRYHAESRKDGEDESADPFGDLDAADNVTRIDQARSA